MPLEVIEQALLGFSLIFILVGCAGALELWLSKKFPKAEISKDDIIEEGKKAAINGVGRQELSNLFKTYTEDEIILFMQGYDSEINKKVPTTRTRGGRK